MIWLILFAALLFSPLLAPPFLRYVHREYKEKNDYPRGW